MNQRRRGLGAPLHLQRILKPVSPVPVFALHPRWRSVALTIVGGVAKLPRTLRAYIFGHVSATGPRLVGILLSLLRNHRDAASYVEKFRKTILRSLDRHSFPSFCGILIGSYSTLSLLFLDLLRRLRPQFFKHDKRSAVRLSRLLAAFISAWYSLPLLLKLRAPENAPSEEKLPPNGAAPPAAKPAATLAGNTLDLTVLASVRAAETALLAAWRSGNARRPVPPAVDTAVFVASAGTVMWHFIYNPDRLPRSYTRWIASAAEVDQRLLDVLRLARAGAWRYGRDDGHAEVIGSLCRERGWPAAWGDPSRTAPLPCCVVHQGVGGASCHAHGALRFLRAFRFAAAMYLPLQLAVKLRRPSLRALVSAVKDAARSSAFLGAFVALFYYAVCLARTQVGPRLLPPHKVAPIVWDRGPCIAAGCAACGWSLLLEPPRRRQELAFFVAPRAVASLLPRSYDAARFFGRERLAFAAGVAVLFTAAHEDSRKVRGVLGQLLHSALAA